MPTCPAPLVAQKKCGPPSGIGRQEVTQLLEPNFPEHHHQRHGHGTQNNAHKPEAKCSKHSRAQQQESRNVYTWISAPRAIYNNKRLMRMSNDRRGKPTGWDVGEGSVSTKETPDLTCVKMPTLSAHQQQNQQQELLELESPAFSIVPSDLYRAGSIGKPNAIVRPLRHGPHREVIEGQHIVDLHPDYKLLHELEEQLIRNNRGRDGNNNNSATGVGQESRNNYGGLEPGTGEKTERKKPQQHEFSRELDAKLRKLQSDSSKRSSKNGSTQEVNVRKRPLFITTVPKGVFLQPSRDLPVPLPASSQRRLYAFESRPRILTAPSFSHGQHQHQHLNNNNDINHPNHNHPGEYVCKHGSHHYNKPAATRPANPDDGRTEAVVARKVAELQSIAGQPPTHHNAHRAVSRVARDPQQQQQPSQQQGITYQNVMHDRRVVRGSNYTSSTNLQVGGGDGDSTQKEAEARRRQMLRKKYVSRNQRGIIGTPPPVRGRRHETVQTEKYLEELFLHPPELDAGCQTDLFLHRPPSPPFVPAKTGCDASTEILDGELFDFDTEVQPIIEVLVSRTLEQALVEVLHEEEIAEMKEQQQNILALRDAELAELRRLELEERKRHKERESRFLQDKIAHDLDREMQERITAAKLLQGRLDDLVPEVVAAVDKIETEKDREEFERQIAPWLAKEVAHEIGQWIDSTELLEDIIREILLQKKKALLGEDNAEDTAEGQYDEVDPDEVNPDEAEPETAPQQDTEAVEETPAEEGDANL
ncbi:AGAP005880-PA-like protein [Anopheles sinensis]|uniref:AGAP005880-PA-like protein n=1 Tax=Anopheles sinensis TaxID=74873 RepID=A0A084W2S5_ANOSI|nr:AGAP005880-PA-like protein [Anopheles sinensis]